MLMLLIKALCAFRLLSALKSYVYTIVQEVASYEYSGEFFHYFYLLVVLHLWTYWHVRIVNWVMGEEEDDTDDIYWEDELHEIDWEYTITWWLVSSVAWYMVCCPTIWYMLATQRV
jgi:hypothetical protein